MSTSTSMDNINDHKDSSYKVNTEQYWDTVSAVYSSKDLTHHMADFELGSVLACIKGTEIDSISCFGVADGNRDPIQILKYISDMGTKLPSELILDDISSKMIEETERNLISGGWADKIRSIKYIHSPLSQIASVGSEIDNKRIAYFIGVYNADYLKESLELYSKNRDVIGEKFTVSALYIKFDSGKPAILKSISVNFDIKNIDDQLTILNAMRNSPDFYAFSILTEKDFVSHYFDATVLNSLLRNIFDGYSVSTYKGIAASDRRYIVNVINSVQDSSQHTGHPNCIVTMLNNVLGNIKCEDHILSLTRLRDLYKNGS
jgi:hypothetical protein